MTEPESSCRVSPAQTPSGRDTCTRLLDLLGSATRPQHDRAVGATQRLASPRLAKPTLSWPMSPPGPTRRGDEVLELFSGFCAPETICCRTTKPVADARRIVRMRDGTVTDDGRTPCLSRVRSARGSYVRHRRARRAIVAADTVSLRAWRNGSGRGRRLGRGVLSPRRPFA